MAWGRRCTTRRGRVQCEEHYPASMSCPTTAAPDDACTLVTTSEPRPLELDAPLRVGPADTVIVGHGGMCALRSSGAFLCRDYSYTWPPLDGIRVDDGDITRAAAGLKSVCAISRHGKLRCWIASDSPKRPASHLELGIDDAVDVALSLDSGYVIRKDGTLWAWGSNDRGQRGLGGDSEAEATEARSIREQVESAPFAQPPANAPR